MSTLIDGFRCLFLHRRKSWHFLTKSFSHATDTRAHPLFSANLGIKAPSEHTRPTSHRPLVASGEIRVFHVPRRAPTPTLFASSPDAEQIESHAHEQAGNRKKVAQCGKMSSFPFGCRSLLFAPLLACVSASRPPMGNHTQKGRLSSAHAIRRAHIM